MGPWQSKKEEGAAPASEPELLPETKLVTGPPCPMCDLPMEQYAGAPALWACYVDGLTWNPFTRLARALRR